MQPASKQQLRTLETQTRLLDAAEEVFIRDGFEGAQLDQIAALADRSKGAVYAHFKSKEDLFLALFVKRMTEYIERLSASVEQSAGRAASLQAFRDFLLGTVADRRWPILLLEFKLYALRHPESRSRLRQAFELSRTTANNPIHEKMFGPLNPAQKQQNDRLLLSFGPLISGLILESHFEPDLLTDEALQSVLGRFFDALFPPA